jgi:type I restriction enzyme M protein
MKNEEIEAQGFVLTPGRFVGAAKVEEDDTPFAERFAALTATLKKQRGDAVRLDAKIAEALVLVRAND